MDPTCVFNFFTFFERILYKSNCIKFIFSWCGTHTKIRSKLVVIVTTGSQKITLWGPQRTPLGILRVKHDLLSTVLREWYKQREATAKLARFRLCAFQRQKQVLFPKGIITTRRQGNRRGQRDIFFEYPSILHNFTARLVPPARRFVSLVIHCYYYRFEQHVKSLTNVTRFTSVIVITNTPHFRQ